MYAWAARALAQKGWPWAAAAVGAALSVPALWAGFLVDDWFHRAMFPRRAGLWDASANMFAFVPGPGRPPPAIDLPWWTAPDAKLSFFRPLSGLTHYLDYQLWPDAAWLMHLHSITWYAAAIVAVALLFRQLMGRGWPAGLAALIFAVSHTHAVPVLFIANRNALIAVTFSAAAISLHHRWRSKGVRGGAAASAAMLLLGLLANEAAVATLGYLGAYALFVDRAPLRSRATSLGPAIVVVASWRVVYQALGYGAWGSAAYIDPIASPMQFFDAAIRRGPILLNAQWLFPPADLATFVARSVLDWWWLGAVAAIAALFAVLFPTLRRDAVSRFWALGMVLAIVPSCATFPMDRLLLHADIGFAGLLAGFIADALSARDTGGPQRFPRVATRIAADVLIALHLIVSVLWLPGRIGVTASAFRSVTHGIEQLAVRPDLAGRLVVIVDDVMNSAYYLTPLRTLFGFAPPRQVLVLSPHLDPNASIVLTREDARTLVMNQGGNYRWFLERDDRHPFAPGDAVDRGPVRVEIRQVIDGKPTEVAFIFDRALDDPSIAWFGRFQPAFDLFPRDGGYPDWTPPAIGRSAVAK